MRITVESEIGSFKDPMMRMFLKAVEGTNMFHAVELETNRNTQYWSVSAQTNSGRELLDCRADICLQAYFKPKEGYFLFAFGNKFPIEKTMKVNEFEELIYSLIEFQLDIAKKNLDARYGVEND